MGSSLSWFKLGGEAVRAGWASRRRGSILPSRTYVRWRIATAYGDPDRRPASDDVAAFLGWRRRQRRVHR